MNIILINCLLTKVCKIKANIIMIEVTGLAVMVFNVKNTIQTAITNLLATMFTVL